MNTSKIALYTNPDEVLTLTPSESIISMFEHTDENGTLYMRTPLCKISSTGEIEQRFRLN